MPEVSRISEIYKAIIELMSTHCYFHFIIHRYETDMNNESFIYK